MRRAVGIKPYLSYDPAEAESNGRRSKQRSLAIDPKEKPRPTSSIVLSPKTLTYSNPLPALVTPLCEFSSLHKGCVTPGFLYQKYSYYY